eukprot:SAG22_NODE_1334_length_4700_cov_27.727885_5_plen_241_part_00
MLRAFDAQTGVEAAGSWSTVLDFPDCAAPAVWSVRAVGKQVAVARSNFGSGSKCPAGARRAAGGAGPSVPLAALPRRCVSSAVPSLRRDCSDSKRTVACLPAVPAAAHNGSILVLPLPAKGTMAPAPAKAAISVISLAHGFPHEVRQHEVLSSISAACLPCLSLWRSLPFLAVRLQSHLPCSSLRFDWTMCLCISLHGVSDSRPLAAACRSAWPRPARRTGCGRRRSTRPTCRRAPASGR